MFTLQIKQPIGWRIVQHIRQLRLGMKEDWCYGCRQYGHTIVECMDEKQEEKNKEIEKEIEKRKKQLEEIDKKMERIKNGIRER